MSDYTVVSVADLHVDHGRWGRVNPETGRSNAWESAQACFLEACTYAIDNRVDGFIALGDMFLNGRPSAEAAEMVSEGFRLLDAAGVPTVVLLGNHELLNVRAGHRHALLRFGDLEHVTVQDEPGLVRLPSGLQVACLPWPRKGRLISELDVSQMAPDQIDDVIAGLLVDHVEDMADEADPDVPVLLAAHAAVGEATIGSNLRGSEMSIRSIFNEPIIPIEALARDPYDHVLLGHIHKRQHMGDRAHYVGSPDRIDFSEEHETKGFTVLTGTSGGVNVELIETNARVLRTVDLEAGDRFDDIAPDTLVRVKLASGETRLDPAVRNEVAEQGGLVVQVKAQPAPRAQPSTGERAVASEGIGPLDGFRLWLEREQVADDDRDRLVTLASGLVDDIEAA